MVAVVRVVARGADVTAEGGDVGRPVPFGQQGFRAAEATVDGHAVFHHKRNGSVGAGGGIVGACGHPYFLPAAGGSQRLLQGLESAVPTGAGTGAAHGRMDVQAGTGGGATIICCAFFIGTHVNLATTGNGVKLPGVSIEVSDFVIGCVVARINGG